MGVKMNRLSVIKSKTKPYLNFNPNPKSNPKPNPNGMFEIRYYLKHPFKNTKAYVSKSTF